MDAWAIEGSISPQPDAGPVSKPNPWKKAAPSQVLHGLVKLPVFSGPALVTALVLWNDKDMELLKDKRAGTRKKRQKSFCSLDRWKLGSSNWNIKN